jgi:hypothetical protein
LKHKDQLALAGGLLLAVAGAVVVFRLYPVLWAWGQYAYCYVVLWLGIEECVAPVPF